MFSYFKQLAFLWEMTLLHFALNYIYAFRIQIYNKFSNNKQVQRKTILQYFWFIDNLCGLNDGGEFGKPFYEIYPTEPELKVEHHRSHPTFLDLGISIGKGTFIYKMFDKRNTFNFHYYIIRLPSITSNIPSIILYRSFCIFYFL